MAKGGAVFLIALGVLCLPATVAAAAPTTADKQARELFQKAEMSFNLGKFPEALADYQAAYQAKPLPAFLFNVAQCYRNMQSYEQARFFYRRYLALDPHTTNRRLVEDLITEMTHLVEKSEQAKPAADAPAVAPPPLATTPPATPPPALPTIPATTLDEASRGATTPGPPPIAAGDQPSRPFYKRGWFWGCAGAVVAGAAVAALLITRNNAPQGSLETINGR